MNEKFKLICFNRLCVVQFALIQKNVECKTLKFHSLFPDQYANTLGVMLVIN